MATNHKIELDRETIEIALTYHERTKHHSYRYANSAGYLADVFISYSSNDQNRVVKLADKLRSAGVSIWVDESGIGAATLWSKEIVGAIKACKVLVLMVTPNSVKSKNGDRIF